MHSTIQQDIRLDEDHTHLNEDECFAQKNNVDFRSTKQLIDAAEVIKKNEDLVNKLEVLQKDIKNIGTADDLTKDQIELLKMHERHDHVISTPDIKLLAAAGCFPKRLARCTHPACATCCYGYAHRKPW